MCDKELTYQEKKIEELHWELQGWKSKIQFMEDEMLFINRLLNSYVFEPRTPNLFERLELFKEAYKKSKREKEKLKSLISIHENNISGILECTSSICDFAYYEKHEKLNQRVSDYFEKYHQLKSDIYSYAESILKRRKPSKK